MSEKHNIPVEGGTLTAERVDERHIEFTRDHGDEVEHKARLFVFPKDVLERLHVCGEIAHERIRKDLMKTITKNNTKLA